MVRVESANSSSFASEELNKNQHDDFTSAAAQNRKRKMDILNEPIDTEND